MKSAVVAVLLGSSLLWARQRPKSSDVLVITNVNVVDTRYGGIAPNSTVIIKDGIIKAVTKVAAIDTGANVRVVNAGGQYLIPGLWDMHAHFSAASASDWDSQSLYAQYLASGVIGLREPGKGDDRIQLVNGLREQATDDPLGEILPYLHTAFPANSLTEQRTIEGVGDVLLACSSKEDELRRKQAAPPEQDADAPVSPPGREIRATYDPQKAEDLFLRISNHATWMVPGLVSLEAPIATLSDDDWDSLTDPFSIKWSRAQATEILENKAAFERARLLIHDMRRTGVQFLAGTNGPRENVPPGHSLHRELELLVKSGFTPLDAVRSATFNAALYIAKLNKYGVVEAGHVADLVLLEGNPLQDITNVEKVSGVIMEGKYFSRTALDSLLSSIKRNPPQPLKSAAVPAPKTEQ
jgi:Amidohydrolase family